MSRMISGVMNVMGSSVVVNMLPSSAVTSTASSTTARTAGPPSIPCRTSLVTDPLSKKAEIAHVHQPSAKAGS